MTANTSRRRRRLWSASACLLLAAAVGGSPLDRSKAAETTAAETNAAANPAPLRLCLDPDNLPFSSASATPGFYVELARDIAKALGRSLQPVWVPTYNTKRQIRLKLLAGQCDGFIGVPEDTAFMGPKLIFSQPIVQLGYAFVAPAASAVDSVESLHGKRVAVQWSSPPQNLLASDNAVQLVTVLSPEEAMQDLAAGKADAAFIWGASAGWLNISAMHSAYRVVPFKSEHTEWGAGIAFSRDQTELRDAVNHALTGLAPAIGALAVKYGFPTATPTPAPAATNSNAPAVGPGGASEPKPATPAPSADTQTIAASPRPEDVAAGRKIFNGTCAHCHGPDAMQGEQRRNLRMLRERYGNDFPKTFMFTVTHGRVNKGMPNWSGIVSDDEFHKILAFLTSVQDPGS